MWKGIFEPSKPATWSFDRARACRKALAKYRGSMYPDFGEWVVGLVGDGRRHEIRSDTQNIGGGEMPKDRPRESFIMNHTDNEGSEPTTEEVRRLEAALLALDRPAVWALLRSAEGNPVSVTRLERLMVPALENIGRSWEAGGVALSQVYMSGRLCEEVLNAAFDPASRPPLNHPAMAMAVLEDNHALGKTMVCSMLRACGYTLNEYELGIGVQALIQRVVRDDIKILLISTLMLRSALQVKQVTAALEKARPETRVLVGGAPFLFDADLWREVGAHAMGRNASDAVRIIQPWCVPPAGTP